MQRGGLIRVDEEGAMAQPIARQLFQADFAALTAQTSCGNKHSSLSGQSTPIHNTKISHIACYPWLTRL